MEPTFDEILIQANQTERKHGLFEVSDKLRLLIKDFRSSIHDVQVQAENKALDLLQNFENLTDKLHIKTDAEEKAFRVLTGLEEMSERLQAYTAGFEDKVTEGQLQLHLALSEVLDRWQLFKQEYEEVFGPLAFDNPLKAKAEEWKVQAHLGQLEANERIVKSKEELSKIVESLAGESKAIVQGLKDQWGRLRIKSH